MSLIDKVDKTLKETWTPQDILYYIRKWHDSSNDYNNHWENFSIDKDSKGVILLTSTLHNIDQDTLMQIAIDLGIETPDFIPSIPIFKNELKGEYDRAHQSFLRAYRNVTEHPDSAIGLANSTLESIIKEILKDDRVQITYDKKRTLCDLTSSILKAFKMFPGSDLPVEISTMGSSILALSQGVEALRSEKTSVHGKTAEDYVISDPLYAMFILNCVTTVGLFLISYFKKKFPKTETSPEETGQPETDDLLF